MKLKIGRRLSVDAPTLEAAQRAYAVARDESGEGYSTFPQGRWGKHRISYNGRAWLADVVVSEPETGGAS